MKRNTIFNIEFTLEKDGYIYACTSANEKTVSKIEEYYNIGKGKIKDVITSTTRGTNKAVIFFIEELCKGNNHLVGNEVPLTIIVKNMLADDLSEYTKEICILYNHFYHQLLDIATDSYNLGISNQDRNEAKKQLETTKRFYEIDKKYLERV